MYVTIFDIVDDIHIVVVYSIELYMLLTIDDGLVVHG
jgi:hypothetical protein